jgi:hypothetical protein
VRRDNDWLFEMSLLPEVARFLGDVDGAEVLYGLLLPYAGRNATTSPEASTGSISRVLGILASMSGRWDAAVRHLEDALRWNIERNARPWVRTRNDFALMLLDPRGQRREARPPRALSDSREPGDRFRRRVVR